VKKRRVDMKSKLFLWLVAAMIGTAFASPPVISAAEKKAEEKMAPTKEKSKSKSATGELVSADAKAGKLTVKVKQREMDFSAETKTAKAALNKVKVGDTVTVSYTEKDGKMLASSIKAAAKKTEKMEEKKGTKGKM
jgi:Cu/Ag efflux protein CusF